MSDERAEGTPAIVSGRSCGTCSLCCKVLRIEEVQSPAGEWCRHCDPGHGCRIHPTRPNICRDFYCMWLTHKEVGAHWMPARCKMVLRWELNGARLAVHVDGSSPGAWRRSPYYQDLKRWAELAVKSENQVSVWIGRQAIVILPDRDIDLGTVAEDEVVVSLTRVTSSGRVYDAQKIKRSEAADQQRSWSEARRKASIAGAAALQRTATSIEPI
jgi:hypothetical protein